VVTDEIELFYQTEQWGQPTQLKLVEKRRVHGVVTVKASLLDEKGTLCLDSAKVIRFSLSGSGVLVDNLGTTTGSREVQMSNGCAEISVALTGDCRIQAAPEGLLSASLEL